MNRAPRLLTTLACAAAGALAATSTHAQPAPPGAVPPPPPADDAERPPSYVPAPAPAPAPAAPPRLRPPSVGRVIGEAAGGALAGALGGGALGALGFAVNTATESTVPWAAAGGVLVGWTLAVPAGVTLAGRGLGGDGAYWASLVGSAAGAVVGGGLYLAASDGGEGALGVALALGLPVAGAIVGYELSATRVDAQGRPRASVAPSFVAGREGAALGVAGTF